MCDNFDKYRFLDSRVHFHHGLFKNTLPQFRDAETQKARQIAVLRIDCNYYDSHQDALYYLYPMVPVGGVVIFDDVLHSPEAMNAWIHFKMDHGLPEDLIQIDHFSAWFRKTIAIGIDFSRFKPPRDAYLKRFF